jgi:hypothetical protein
MAFAQSDTDPPALANFDLSPTSVDVTTGAASVTCTAIFTDNLSGVQGAGCYLQPPSGNARLARCSLVSGDNLSGTWECSHTIPQYSVEGQWRASLSSVRDVVGPRIPGHSGPPVPDFEAELGSDGVVRGWSAAISRPESRDARSPPPSASPKSNVLLVYQNEEGSMDSAAEPEPSVGLGLDRPPYP